MGASLLGSALVLAVLQKAIAARVIAIWQSQSLKYLASAALAGLPQGLALGRPEEMAEFKSRFYAFAADKVAYLIGLDLDSEAPFSDRSWCEAIGKKTGVELRTLKDRESIRKDIERWGLVKLEEQTGLHIRDIRDKEKTTKDLMKFATPTVVMATGLPITDLSDTAKVKEDVGEYLEDRALVMLSENLGLARETVQGAFDSVGTSINTIIEKIEKKGGYTADGRPAIKVDLQLITLGVLSRALLNADRRRREKEAGLAGVGRRQGQLRAGLKRFREKHGSRMTYERV